MSEFFATNAPDSPHWNLNSCFGVFCTLWFHLGLFCCLTKLGAKREEMVQLMQKFVPRSRVGIFRNERSRSTPLEPELMFWCVSYSLGAFGIISLPYKISAKRAEMIQLMQKFVPQSRVGIFRNGRSRSTPLDPKLMFWYMSYCSDAFGTISLPYKTRCKTG